MIFHPPSNLLDFLFDIKSFDFGVVNMLLLNLGFLRAIAMRDSVLIFDYNGNLGRIISLTVLHIIHSYPILFSGEEKWPL